MTIFFTGILHLFLLRRRRVGIDVRASLTMILVKKMPAVLRQPASFMNGASAAAIYAAL
ncbi:hypothetical protein [Bradyrhizobium sp. McL0615]|uniref:hypothetical protein n=1 Tax=Bradyrhizobium sp. McL0615 TaxID=3415673 RepID=UPI003CF05507